MPARLPAPLILYAGGVALLALAAVLAACAPESTPVASGTPAATRIAGASYGTIIGTRPLAVRGEGAGNGSRQDPGLAQAVEFTVREDDGTDVQIAQTNEERLQAGDRVVIARGDPTRVARAGGGSSPMAQAPRAAGAAR
jgi:outer membrane lipoprotein SlyB